MKGARHTPTIMQDLAAFGEENRAAKLKTARVSGEEVDRG